MEIKKFVTILGLVLKSLPNGGRGQKYPNLSDAIYGLSLRKTNNSADYCLIRSKVIFEKGYKLENMFLCIHLVPRATLNAFFCFCFIQQRLYQNSSYCAFNFYIHQIN